MAEGGISKENGPDSHIIAGVIEGVRQSFIDSGVDMEVLAKLEQLWVSKLGSSNSNGMAIADVRMQEPAPSRKGRGWCLVIILDFLLSFHFREGQS